jgi:hypothetical protein
MSNLFRLPIASEDVAFEFGKEIYGARLDPSDPEICFNFLYTQFPERWREVMANMDGAIYAAGQMYIDAEMRRAG